MYHIILCALLNATVSMNTGALHNSYNQSLIKTGQLMKNTSTINISPKKLKDTLWKIGSKQTISWEIDSLPPEGEYVTEINLVDQTTKLSVGSIPASMSKATNGLHTIDYNVSTLILGGDAIQPLNPGKYQLKYKIIKLEADDGKTVSYRPKYSPEYFMEIISEVSGEDVEVTK
jgi:hypothetical protein